MRRMLVVAAALAVVAGCGKGSQGGGGLYRIEVAGGVVKAGEKAAPTIRFLAGTGFHWNEEFPAKVKVTDPGGLEPERVEFKQSAGDFQAVDGAGVLAIPVAAPKPGKAVLKASADFSVCDAKTCQVFRGVAVEVPVDVQ